MTRFDPWGSDVGDNCSANSSNHILIVDLLAKNNITLFFNWKMEGLKKPRLNPI